MTMIFTIVGVPEVPDFAGCTARGTEEDDVGSSVGDRIRIVDSLKGFS